MEITNSLINTEFSTELINSLIYYNNYGELLNANCCDLSLFSNQLAICTTKHVFVMKFNFSWPSHINNSSPYKYLSNDLSSKQSKNSIGSSSSQIDHWLQDLNESKNETIFLNQIDTKTAQNLVSFSNDTIDLYERFFQLDETQRKKRKLFGRHTKEPVNVKKEKTNQENVQSVCRRDEKYTKDIEEIKSNKIAHAEHQILFEQSKLFDASYYELLSQMNTKSYQQNSNGNKSLLFEGYKYCKWNSNPNRALLATISTANQLVLFDCSKLKSDSTSNSSKNVNSFNFTDYLVNWHHSYMKESKFDRIQEYLLNMNRLIPLFCAWSTKIIVDELHGFEFLFVANKSNEINVVLLPDNELAKDSQFIDLKMIQSIDCFEYLDLNVDIDDEALGNSLFNRDLSSSYTISSLKSINQSDTTLVLIVGFSTGHVLILKLDLDQANLCEALKDSRVGLNELKITPINTKNSPSLNRIDRIECFSIDNSAHLLIVQSQNQLLFHRLNMSTGKIEKTFYFQFRNAADVEKTYENFYFTKNNYKLIGFEKCSVVKSDQIDFVLTFENSLVQLLEFDLKKFEAHLKNDQHRLFLNCLETDTDKIDSFKCTRKMFISSNGYLLFQINDFTKGNLVQKKSPNFQVNIYRINSLEKLLECLLKMDNDSDLNSLQIRNEKADLIWLFKRQLYLNFDSVVTQHSFQHFYDLLKNATKSKSDQKNLNANLRLFKHLRIMSHFIRNYFETCAILDDFNKKSACQHEDKKRNCEASNDEDTDEDEDEENDEDDDDEDNNEEPSRQKSMIEPKSKSKMAKHVSESNTSTHTEIIKSPEFYNTMFKEYSYHIYKYYAIGLIVSAYKIDTQVLNDHEKLVVYLMNEFCTKKNFYDEFDWSLWKSKEKPINEKQIKSWFEKNSKQFEKSVNKLNDSQKCNLCCHQIKIDTQLDLDQIKCETGHRLNRCQRTLLPLNFNKYTKCSLCNSTWNLLDANEYPNITRLITRKESCLFCS